MKNDSEKKSVNKKDKKNTALYSSRLELRIKTIKLKAFFLVNDCEKKIEQNH